MPTIIAEFGPEAFPEEHAYMAVCQTCDLFKANQVGREVNVLEYFRGWFHNHVVLTGHRITVTRIDP